MTTGAIIIGVGPILIGDLIIGIMEEFTALGDTIAGIGVGAA